MSSVDENYYFIFVGIAVIVLLIVTLRNDLKSGRTCNRNQVCQKDQAPFSYWFHIIFRIALLIFLLYSAYAINAG